MSIGFGSCFRTGEGGLESILIYLGSSVGLLNFLYDPVFKLNETSRKFSVTAKNRSQSFKTVTISFFFHSISGPDKLLKIPRPSPRYNVRPLLSVANIVQNINTNYLFHTRPPHRNTQLAHQNLYFLISFPMVGHFEKAIFSLLTLLLLGLFQIFLSFILHNEWRFQIKLMKWKDKSFLHQIEQNWIVLC